MIDRQSEYSLQHDVWSNINVNITTGWLRRLTNTSSTIISSQRLSAMIARL